MSVKRPARDVAQFRQDGEVWIDHADLVEDDAPWMGEAAWLTLWNVRTPMGFLASLPALQGLDIRGGSAKDLTMVDGCAALRSLTVNQVRGVHDLSGLTSLTGLEYLRLYGLAQVTQPPSLAALRSLRRLELGQMRGLPALGGFLDAPGLQELFLHKRVAVTPDDVDRIRAHPRLRAFDWFAEDVPTSRWQPVVDAIALPKLKPMFPQDWLRDIDRGEHRG